MLVQPTLNLQFARSRFPDPRISFSRPSSATYTNALGQVATAAPGQMRFDYDPVTGQSLGALIEESRGNLLLWSQDFVNAWWEKSNATVEPSGVAPPNGSGFANKYIGSTGTSWKRLLKFLSVTAGATYTVSWFVKAGEARYCSTYFRSSEFGGSNNANTLVVDLQTGDYVAGTGVKATVTRLWGGWYRVSITGVSIASAATQVVLSLADSLSLTNAPDFAGDGVRGIYIWGAQLNEGGPTSCIPTTDAPATRAADVTTIPTSAFAFNPREGTVFVEVSTFDTTPTDRRIVMFNDGTTSNQIGLHYGAPSGGVHSSAVSANGAFQAGTPEGPYDTRAVRRAFAYGNGSFHTALDGGAGIVASGVTLPTALTQLQIGHRNGLQHLNGHISRVVYWPRAFDMETLQKLTGGAA